MLDAVRDVAVYAAGGDADAARLVSKGEWDDAREAGFPDLPTAESVRQRLRITHWRSVLAVVFLPAEQRRQAIGTYTKRVGAFGRGAAVPELVATPVEREQIERLLAENGLDELPVDPLPADAPMEAARELPNGSRPVVVAITDRALRAVMFRVGHSPAAQEYDHEVQVMEDHRRRAGLPPLGFPTSDSVIRRFGSWQAACVACDVEPPTPFRQQPGASLVEVVDACTDFWGALPGKRAARAFAGACDVSLQYRDDGWDSILAEVRQFRAERGVDTPDRVIRSLSEYPPMPTSEEAEAIRRRLGNPPRHRKEPWTVDEAYEGLRIYKREYLAPGDRPTTPHYMAACRKDKRLVWPSSLKETTGKTFTKLIAEVGM